MFDCVLPPLLDRMFGCFQSSPGALFCSLWDTFGGFKVGVLPEGAIL